MIIVTGGMGFIGMHTVRALLDAGESVVPTSHRSCRIPEIWQDEVGKRVFPEMLDVNNAHDSKELARKHKPKESIHLAGPPMAGMGNGPGGRWIPRWPLEIGSSQENRSPDPPLRVPERPWSAASGFLPWLANGVQGAVPSNPSMRTPSGPEDGPNPVMASRLMATVLPSVTWP